MRTTVDVWSYREGVLAPDVSPRDVVGYGVEATDGSIGKVDDATYEVGSSYLVVDTGPWIFGKKVMLPAGVIQSVDDEAERIFVDRTKEQIKNAPEFDDSLLSDEGYRNRLGSYYGDDR
jgi:hypothetical protein